MKKIFLISLILLIAVSVFLSSCGEETTTTPATTTPAATTPAATTPAATTPAATTPAVTGPTGTLRATAPSWIETLDPNLQTTFEYALYEHLIGIDESGAFIGELATDWSVSDDGLVWTYNIRKGIKFHNGEDFTAEDAKFSIERIMKEGSMSPWVGEYKATIDHMETPDDYTLEIYCTKVNYMFYTSIWGCPMVPKDYIEANGDAYFNEHPVGTSPWKFVKLTPGVSIELEAVPDHWRITPEWANLIVELVPESSTALAKLRNGETDIVDVNMDTALQVQSEGYELRIMGRPTTPVICMLGSWATEGPLSDARVRQALSLAINRQEVTSTFFNGLATPGGVVWTAPSSWGYDSDWTTSSYFKYDRDAAKALLAEAGYPDAFANPVIKIYSHPTQAWLPDMHLIVAGYWQAIGVQTEVVSIDGGELRAKMYGGGDESLWGAACIWNMPTVQVSVPFLMSAIHSAGNWQLLHDEAWDTTWASIGQEPSQDEQIALFRQTAEYMLDKYVCVGIANLYTNYAVSDEIGDWTLRFQYDLWGGFAGIKKK